MSWKLTKKFKETHLAPLANPFSRSSSTSTVVSSSQQHTATAENESAGSQMDVQPTPPSDPKGITASEALSSPPPAPLKPGILVVTLHEGKGFALRDEDKHLFEKPVAGNSFSSVGSARPTSASFVQHQHSNSASFARPHTSAAGSGINAVPTIHGRYSAKNLPYALIDFDKQQVFVNAVAGSPENPFWAGGNTAYKFDISRATELTVSFYIRNPNAPSGAGRAYDYFLGSSKITPRFEEASIPVTDQKGTKKTSAGAQEKIVGQMGVEWIKVQHNPSASVKVGVEFVENRQQSLNIDDFQLLKVVGKGSFGKVMQVKKKDTHRIYALKTIRKAHIINRSEVSHTLAERSVLAQINNPFIVPLKFSFQSPDKLYLVLAFVNGGELFHHLQKETRFDPNRARFYTAELLCALECLHGFNVIYRDLKPENILLDYTGHIALCDFGLCKLDMKDDDRTNTFCGTPEYLAPELLHGHGYTKSVDWWTLGVLLYEMLTGLPPYYDEHTNDMYRKILTDPLHFPQDENIMPAKARKLLEKLLDRNPERRLGARGASEIKEHPFFDDIDWRKLLQRKYEPTFKPNVVDQLDTANFDREFTSEPPTDSYVEGPTLSTTMQQQFAGWSYNRPVAGLGDAGGSVKDPSFGSVAK